MESMKKQTILKYIPYAVIVVLIIMLAIGGGYGYNYHNDREKVLKDSIETIKKQKAEVDIKYRESLNKIPEQKQNIKTYYNEFIYYKNKSESLQKSILDINTLNFTIEYLDSLKQSVNYR